MADNIEQALALIKLDPLPDDIELQLKQLESKATQYELLEFPWIWEGLDMAREDNGQVELR